MYSQDYEEEEGGLLRLELLETDKRNLGSVSRHWRRSQVSCGWWRLELQTKAIRRFAKVSIVSYSRCPL